MANKKSETANIELIERLKGVLRKYFETDDNGHKNKEYLSYFAASDAIDEIEEIIDDYKRSDPNVKMIRKVFKKYYENYEEYDEDDEEYDEYYAAQNAIDDIHNIVGKI